MASFEMLSYMSGPLLGQMFMGFLGETLGVANALLVGGIAAISLMALAVFCLPELVQFRDQSRN